jgi:SpoVK/Ycf46/Vps4 family AAA+-type ATPase
MQQFESASPKSDNLKMASVVVVSLSVAASCLFTLFSLPSTAFIAKVKPLQPQVQLGPCLVVLLVLFAVAVINNVVWSWSRPPPKRQRRRVQHHELQVQEPIMMDNQQVPLQASLFPSFLMRICKVRSNLAHREAESLSYQEQSGIVIVKHQQKQYGFDHVYGPQVTQENVFVNQIDPLIGCVFTKGWNICIAAYGVTKRTSFNLNHAENGSTARTLAVRRNQHDFLLPHPKLGGIIFRAMHVIFQTLQQRVIQATCKVSVFAVSPGGSEIWDLLFPRRRQVLNGQVSSHECSGLRDVQNALSMAYRSAYFGFHLVFVVKVESIGMLALVDYDIGLAVDPSVNNMESFLKQIQVVQACRTCWDRIMTIANISTEPSELQETLKALEFPTGVLSSSLEFKDDYVEENPNFQVENPPLQDVEEEPRSAQDIISTVELEKEKDEIREMIEQEILDTSSCTMTLDQVMGLGNVKQALYEAVVCPVLNPDLFSGLRSPPKGILLFGPPGNGKTMIAKAVAAQVKATFFNITASVLTSRWLGESEKLVRTLFTIARERQPSVIFIDEIDSLLTTRSQKDSEDSLKTEFLIAFDGVGTGDNDKVLVMGATNHPESLDEAVRRRFGRRIYVPLPGAAARAGMIQSMFKSLSLELSEEEMEEVVAKTEGYSGSDIKELCKDVAWSPLRRIDTSILATLQPQDAPGCGLNDFLLSLDSIKPTVDESCLAKLIQWNEKFGEKILSHCGPEMKFDFNPNFVLGDEERKDAVKEDNAVIATRTATAKVTKINKKIRKNIEQEIMDKKKSNLRLDNVIGLSSVKQLLFEAVVCPSMNPLLFTGLRSAPKGVLLFGPPGNGKTMIAKAVAAQCEATFFHVSASVLTSKNVGESEKLVRALFAIAREKQPSVIFIDEIDSVLSARSDNDHPALRRLKTEFLTAFDGVGSRDDDKVLLMAATNLPHCLDEAVRRRFARRIYVPLPEAAVRAEIISRLFKDDKLELTKSEMEELVTRTEGYSGSDLKELCGYAAKIPLRGMDVSVLHLVSRKDAPPTRFSDFQEALENIKPSVSQEGLQVLEQWNAKFGTKR